MHFQRNLSERNLSERNLSIERVSSEAGSLWVSWWSIWSVGCLWHVCKSSDCWLGSFVYISNRQTGDRCLQKKLSPSVNNVHWTSMHIFCAHLLGLTLSLSLVGYSTESFAELFALTTENTVNSTKSESFLQANFLKWNSSAFSISEQCSGWAYNRRRPGKAGLPNVSQTRNVFTAPFRRSLRSAQYGPTAHRVAVTSSSVLQLL